MFTIASPWAGKKDPESVCCHFWYLRLFSAVMALYEWKGEQFDNGELNRDYLEFWLLTERKVGFMRDHKGNLRVSRCSEVGFDFYGVPTTMTINNPILGTPLHGVIGSDAVLMHNNMLWTSVHEIVQYYAELLGKAQISLRVNLDNTRITKVFPASDDDMGNQIRKLYDDVSRGKPAVIVKDNLLQKINEMGSSAHGEIPVFGVASDFLADKFTEVIRQITSDFYYQFGVDVNGGNQVKSQYTSIPEVSSNDQQLIVNRDFWLEPRKKACEEVNKLFGVSLSVDLRKPEMPKMPVEPMNGEGNNGSDGDDE